MLRGAVFGFGNMGQQFTRFVNENDAIEARIVAATNRGADKLVIAREEYGLATSHDIEEVLGMDLDFVLIGSTSIAHADQVVAAAEAGCHVFCEKPIAVTLGEADRMIDAVERAGVITVVNYISRFNEAYRKVHELLNAGELGRPLSIGHSRIRGYGLYAAGARHRAILEPEESGGWAVHHACHDTDLLYWLGGPVSEVYGRTGTTVPDSHSEELVTGLLAFESGATGFVEDSVCALREHYTRVIGEKGSLVLTGEHESTRFRLKREGSETEERLQIQDRKRKGNGLDHFFDCLASGSNSPHSLKEARHSLEIAIALQRSARLGKPITLPLDE